MDVGMFSHASIDHLSGNMVAFTRWAPPTISLLGPVRFWHVIIFSGISSRLGAQLSEKFRCIIQSKRKNIDILLIPERGSLGFSGINMGLFFFYCIAKSQSNVSITDSSKENVMNQLKTYLILDLFGIFFTIIIYPSSIGHGAHLGGLAGGWLYKSLLCSQYSTKNSSS